MTTAANRSNDALFKRWMEIGQHVAQDSVNILQDYMRHPTAVDDLYEKSVNLAHETVNETLRLERDQLAELEKNEPELPAVKGGVELATAMTRAGIDMRSQLWESWFRSVEAFNPGRPANLLETMKDPASVLEAWRQATDRLFSNTGTGSPKGHKSAPKAAATQQAG